MQQSQIIPIPQELTKHKDFLIRISQNNEKIYSHIEYMKHLVSSMYEMYRKLSKSVIKLSEQYEKKLLKLNDPTALSIINFIKGIQKLFMNIKQQIGNNTVNMNNKNQKVSRTRKDIIHEKLVKINELFAIYMQKVQKFNHKQKEYEKGCQYFSGIEQDCLKFYSMKENKSRFEELVKKQSAIQQQLEETYSLKIQLKSGLCEIRLSLTQFFEMMSSNAQDDKKLLLSVRKKLKQTKFFNETIIEQVNSQAEQSVVPQKQQRRLRKPTDTINEQQQEDQSDSQQKDVTPLGASVQGMQTQCTFSSFNTNTTIQKDFRQISKNIENQHFCIETFCEFVLNFEKEIHQNAQHIDKLRNTQQFLKFIDKKFQINQLLTSDMVYNVEAIKNQIADIRQIIQSIKALLDKKKVINQLKKYRAMKYQRFALDSQVLVEAQRKSIVKNEPLTQLRQKYLIQKHKFSKGHLELMRRFRQMVQDMFRQINQKFKFQRNPQLQSRKIKNEFIKKKYYCLLMLNFFVSKEQPPKFQMNHNIKSYEKYLSEQNLKKVGLLNVDNGDNRDSYSGKKGWGCCGMLFSPSRSKKNKYIDQYNCALKQGYVLIQGKMKIHPSYFKFVSSFNPETLFGETNIRIPKRDIQSFERSNYLLSLLVIVHTVRGRLQFTSFLTDPFKKLQEVYESKDYMKRTGNTNNTDQNLPSIPFKEQNPNVQKSQGQTFSVTNPINHPSTPRNFNLINQLQQKFQSEIPQMIDKKLISFESLSTYLSQTRKQLSISVQYHMVGQKDKRYFFEIKIIQKNNKLQYKFIHQKTMEHQGVKMMLQNMAKQIIQSKSASKFQTKQESSASPLKVKKRLQQFDTQSPLQTPIRQKSQKLFSSPSYSFIQHRENNQFQFQADPSFVYVKQPSIAHGGQPSFNYIPDLQIFRNMSSDRRLRFRDGSQEGFEEEPKKNVSIRSNKSGKRNSRQLSKSQIDQYLSSIDESTIKKNLFVKDGERFNSEQTLRGQNTHKQGDKNVSQEGQGKQKSIFQKMSLLMIILIVVIVLNVIVSLSK